MKAGSVQKSTNGKDMGSPIGWDDSTQETDGVPTEKQRTLRKCRGRKATLDKGSKKQKTSNNEFWIELIQISKIWNMHEAQLKCDK